MAKDQPSVYRTPSGRQLSDADIEALADEAEDGYDVDHLKDKQPEDARSVRERLRKLIGKS